MKNKSNFEIYMGDGSKSRAVPLMIHSLDKTGHFDSPECYVAGKGLRDAVNVSLLLEQPLLVTGEPGTGKTRLAASIANELGFDLFKFHTKSSSTARDLFYHYDALGHFHSAQFERGRDREDGSGFAPDPGGGILKSDRNPAIKTENYITYHALGLAILVSMGSDAEERTKVNPYLPEGWRQEGPKRSVVLIDEIDKAPRDFPNDILNEIEEMSFQVKETDSPIFKASPQYKPIIILTSNSEKSLPDAFLRRCIFYYIEFPDAQALTEIVNKRLEVRPENDSHAESRKNTIRFFEKIRDLKLRKKPATAELLNWLCVLEKFEIDPLHLKGDDQEEKLRSTYSILLKNKEDVKTVIDELHPKHGNVGEITKHPDT